MLTEDHFIERMGTFESQDDFSDHEKLKRNIITIANSIDYDDKIKFVLVYIAGIECDEEITNQVIASTNNFKSWPEFDLKQYSAFNLVTQDKELMILNKSFTYALDTRNTAMVEYILNGAEKLFINASINDDQILDLLEDLDDKTNQKILRMLCERDIILLNEDRVADDVDLTVFISQNYAHPTHGDGSIQNDDLSTTNRGMINKSLNIVNIHSQRNSSKMRKKRNPFNKFLEKSDIVEIAIRAPKISDNEELKTITVLFDQLSVPTNETVRLYKLLIYYEQIQTFEMLLRYRMKNGEKTNKETKTNSIILKHSKEGEKQSELTSPRRKFGVSQVSLGRKDDDNVYDFDEIVSDAFSYSISLNKLHIAFYLFKTYGDDVYGNKMECIKSILSSFKNADTQANQVMYLEERLFILEKFIKFIDYNLALEFLNIMSSEISDDPTINFLVYCPNPLKIIVMLLNIVLSVTSKHQNLKFKAHKVRQSLCDIANGVIDTSTSTNEVKDMLIDKTYNGTEVIDMIDILNIIEILQNPMIDSIVSNMYYGSYERESFLKKSTWYKIIEEQTSTMPGTDAIVTRSMKIIAYQSKLSGLSKHYQAQTQNFRNCRRKGNKL